MAGSLPVPQGINSNNVRNIPKQWDPEWFRRFITNHLQQADYRNAIQSCDAALRVEPGNAKAAQLKAKIEETMKILGKN